MTTVAKVMSELKKKGNPARLQAFASHGAPIDNMFGVSVADMKVIAKGIKDEQALACALYEPVTPTRCTWREWSRTARKWESDCSAHGRGTPAG